MTELDRRFLQAVQRSDFYSYLRSIFPIVSGGAKMLPNWHLDAVTHALERVRRGELTRLAIVMPPRSLKSICASVAFPSYVLGHDPAARCVCVSYADSLSRKHANDCRMLMKHPFYRTLFPGTRISTTKDTEYEMATTLGGFRLATSVGGTLTGRGGDYIIIDDPIKPQDAQSEAAREHAKHWYGNTLISRLDNKMTGAIILVMQRLHVDDLVGHILEQGGFEILELPAIAEYDSIIRLGMNRVYHRKRGELLHPAREPLSALNELKREMGSATFAAQYQQCPVPPGGDMIKWHWFSVYETPLLPLPLQAYDRVIVSWDTAMSKHELADYSACVVLGVRGESWDILEVIRARLDYPDLKRLVLKTHERFRHSQSYSLIIENKGSGQSLIQDLKGQGLYPVAIDPEGDKIMRMYGQTAKIESGAVHLPEQAPWLDDFRTEVMAFPNGRHDDQVDALSQAMIFAEKRGRPSIVVKHVMGHH